MFTGLIEEIGHIKKIRKTGKSIEFAISAKLILPGLKVGDSVSIDGACQTVTSLKENLFTVLSVEETITKTKFSKYKTGTKVNLERALQIGERLGGHFVSGHIDTTGKISKITKKVNNWIIEVQIPAEFSSYIINKGSISIDGISLTITDCKSISFSISVIPHTLMNTTLIQRKTGDIVNIEFDSIGKYIQKYIEITHGKKNN